MIYNELPSGGVQCAGSYTRPYISTLAGATGGMDRFVGGELYSYAGASTLGLDHFVGGELLRGVFSRASTSHVYNDTSSAGVQSSGSASSYLSISAARSGGIQAAGAATYQAVGIRNASGGLQVSASPGPGGGGAIVFDSFTGANNSSLVTHTPDSGGSWILHPVYVDNAIGGVTVSLINNQATSYTPSDPALVFHSQTPPSADYDVSATFNVDEGGGIQSAICGRVSPTADTYYRANVSPGAYWDGSSSVMGVTLEKIVTGDWYVLSDAAPYNGGVLTLRMAGATISVLEGASVLISVTDSDIAGPGRAGMWWQYGSMFPDGSGPWAYIDNFTVPGAGGPSRLYVDYHTRQTAGVQSSGSAFSVETWIVTASGGVQSSGSSTHGVIYKPAYSGGIEIAALVNYVAQSAGKPGGGIQSSGSATPFKTLGYNASGGVQASGGVLFGNSYVMATSGGVQSSGAATLRSTYVNAFTSGAEVAGHAGPPNVYPYIATGGLQSSGATGAYAAFNWPVSGGVEISARAMASPLSGGVYTASPSGGLQLSGHGNIPGVTYHIYANQGDGGPIDYDHMVGSTTQLQWTSFVLATPGVWKFGVRASQGGLEEKNVDAYVIIRLDGSGGDVTSLPASPLGLTATTMAAGAIRAAWDYPAGVNKAVGFHVYIGGTAPDYSTPVATVAASFRRHYVSDILGLIDGQSYVIGVRAYNATGEEQNSAGASAIADATGPGPVDSLEASTDINDW